MHAELLIFESKGSARLTGDYAGTIECKSGSVVFEVSCTYSELWKSSTKSNVINYHGSFMICDCLMYVKHIGYFCTALDNGFLVYKWQMEQARLWLALTFAQSRL